MLRRLRGLKATEGITKSSLDDVRDATTFSVFALLATSGATTAVFVTMLILFDGAEEINA